VQLHIDEDKTKLGIPLKIVM